MNVFIHTVDVIQCFVKQNMITFNYFVRIKHVFVILLNCKKTTDLIREGTRVNLQSCPSNEYSEYVLHRSCNEGSMHLKDTTPNRVKLLHFKWPTHVKLVN